MTDDMMNTDARLAAALDGMRLPPVLEQDAVARVAARAVLANAPIARATTWTMRAAAAIAVIALGAATLSATLDRFGGAELPVAQRDMAPLADDGGMVTQVSATGARPIVFELDAPGARSVQVLGDFNRWSREGNSLQRGSDGRWRVTTMLPPGRYVYAYLVDGRRFQRDPMRDAVEDRDFGVTGSELVVGEAP
jgi:hypothetical protein